jgi:phosphate transport system ATP-binding protein
VSEHDAHHHLDLARSEAELARFPGGAVVQLVTGDPSSGDATVVEVHPATVVVTSDRLVAVDGELEWSWLTSDIEAVHHGRSETWTIVVVPGVEDHGVSVSVSDRARFHQVLAGALAGTLGGSAGATSPETAGTSRPPYPPVSPPVVGAPAGAGPGDPMVDEHAVDHHAPAPAVRPDPVIAGAAALVTVDDLHPDPDGRSGETVVIEVVDEIPILPPPPAPPRVEVWPESEDVAEPATKKRRLLTRSDRRGSAEDPMTMLPLAGLEASEISAWFGTHHVLDRVSLMMEPGEVTALIGPSGCGKSTFLRILNRMHEMIPSASLAGEVHLDGEDIYDVQRKLTDARRQIGMVFQKPNPFPAMSIYDNVVASYRLTGTKISSKEKDEVVESCLTKAGLWTEVRDRLRAPGGGLSGGQQQRLCIARALAIRPRVLLMDEPCSALDPTSTRRIEETIMELGSEVTIVIVTHNMQQAARVSDQCAFFLAEQGTPGVIVEHGPTDAMFQSPQDPRTFDYVNGRFG